MKQERFLRMSPMGVLLLFTLYDSTGQICPMSHPLGGA